MKIKFFDETKFENKLSLYKLGEFMTIKNHFFRQKKDGHLE